MTTPTLIGASQPTPALDLDARMALLAVEMDARLAQAAVAFAVNTAHIDIDPVPDASELIQALPLTPTLTPAASPYSTPLADVLHRARIRLETHGWLRGQLRDDQAEARCLYGAIRIEAASAGQVDDACALLLEAIQRDYPGAESIPNWNDNQADAAQPLRYLDRAAQLAADRSL